MQRVVMLAGVVLYLLIHQLILPEATAEWVNVKWVDDGDTILLADGRRVRYIGINAPEVAHAQKGLSAEPFGDAAKSWNRALLNGQRIRLEFDHEKKDRYGRILAYVYLEDGRFVNLEMVESGHAYVLFLKPNTRFDRVFLEAQRRAMSAGAGMWRDWNEVGTQGVVGNKRSRRFHRPSCPSADTIHPKNRKILADRWEAFWLGYAPAKSCNP